MAKKEKEKFYIVTIIIVLIGLILFWQGIFSSHISIENKILEILDKKVSIEAYRHKERVLSTALTDYASAKEKIDKLNERFVDGASSVEVGKFLSELENSANETSVAMEKVFIENPEVDKKADKKPSTSVPGGPQEQRDKYLQLTVKGKYENLLRFINKLETMPYYIDIKSVDINAVVVSRQDLMKKKDSSAGELQGLIVIKVFKKEKYQ